jgi:hypothetical protein
MLLGIVYPILDQFEDTCVLLVLVLIIKVTDDRLEV